MCELIVLFKDYVVVSHRLKPGYSLQNEHSRMALFIYLFIETHMINQVLLHGFVTFQISRDVFPNRFSSMKLGSSAAASQNGVLLLLVKMGSTDICVGHCVSECLYFSERKCNTFMHRMYLSPVNLRKK